MSAATETPGVSDAPVTGGAFIAVVGPSGAGKDSLINYARKALASRENVFFVRRVITRPADGATESHIPVTVEEFERKRQNGDFAFHWDAHGLKYGLPIEIDSRIRAGNSAVCNGSRAVLEALSRRYDCFNVVSVTASRQAIAQRLALRGRESSEEIHARLERSANLLDPWPGAITVDNSSTIEHAGGRLVEVIERWAD
ncbi:MAG: phosphonate metabolism protein/1,5-bisphosphokinase (PRPP-forming) PhnN [Pseudomonadota bacterium]